MSEWKSIETMPRDGKYYLVWDENSKRPYVLNHPEGHSIGEWTKIRPNPIRWAGSACNGSILPTKWMELPKKP